VSFGNERGKKTYDKQNPTRPALQRCLKESYIQKQKKGSIMKTYKSVNPTRKAESQRNKFKKSELINGLNNHTTKMTRGRIK
jgi:hypothetical protein